MLKFLILRHRMNNLHLLGYALNPYDNILRIIGVLIIGKPMVCEGK